MRGANGRLAKCYCRHEAVTDVPTRIWHDGLGVRGDGEVKRHRVCRICSPSTSRTLSSSVALILVRDRVHPRISYLWGCAARRGGGSVILKINLLNVSPPLAVHPCRTFNESDLAAAVLSIRPIKFTTLFLPRAYFFDYLSSSPGANEGTRLY